MHGRAVMSRRSQLSSRQVPVGAEPDAAGGVHFRVWAPRRRRVEVVFPGGPASRPLAREEDGYFAAPVDDARPGTLYAFRLDDDPKAYPDPASRFQPEGPHGPSEVIDPRAFTWTDGAWRGITRKGQVLYELHIGTFTPEGTYAAAAARLEHLRDVGVTCIEMMPVAEFPGRFGWGYDGVDLYAPTRLYGRPDDLRAFIDRAHQLGLGVILDVVYNHVGPDGNYLHLFSPAYFSQTYTTEWGAAINYDGDDARPVREFFIENAAYWIREFRFDGLRLDATQSIFDASHEHVLAAMSKRARAAAGGRSIVLVAENEPQHTRMVRPLDAGGYGLDALWNDDFHHSAVVAATGRGEAYYTDHAGAPQEFISAAKWGYLFQGQRYRWQEQRRGTAGLDLSPEQFVVFFENHDQVANTARGLRLWQVTTPGRYRALSALVLLSPGTPMLFQGQEFASSKPFLYFADHDPDLSGLVTAGRAEFLEQFPSIHDAGTKAQLARPSDEDTYARCRLDWSECESHAATLALYRDLLHLRRSERAFAAQAQRAVDGAVLGPEAFALRFFDGEPGAAANSGTSGEGCGDRLLLVNLGRDLPLESVPEPLLAPPADCRWTLRWSSEAPQYGGGGTPPIENDAGEWRLPGHCAVVLGTLQGGHPFQRHTRRTA
jgi:maltooligosyltrehalose trehalohydrolase